MATDENDQQSDQIQWQDDVDTSALKPKVAPKAAPAIQWHDTKDTSALGTAYAGPKDGIITPPAVKSPTVEMHYVDPISGVEHKPLPKNFTEVPSKTLPSDETVGKILAIPARMGAAGAEIGSEYGHEEASGLLTPIKEPPAQGFRIIVSHGGAQRIPVYSAEQEQARQQKTAEQHPVAYGVAGGVGGAVGGTIADPTNWALALTGAEAGPIVGKLVSAAFAAKMGKDTVEGAKQLGAEWDTLTPAERDERITQLGLSTVFAGIAGAHATSEIKIPESVKSTAKELITSDETTPSRRASDKGLLNKTWPLIKREAAAAVVPMNERFGINKPTAKEWKGALIDQATPTPETALGKFRVDDQGIKVFQPLEIKFPDGITRWVDKEGEVHVSRRTGEASVPPTTEEPLIPATKAAKPSPWNTEPSPAVPEESLIPTSAKPGARYRGMQKIGEAPTTTPVDTIGKGVSKSGTSPPTAELIPSQPSAVQPSKELIPETKLTAPEAKPFDLSKPVEKPVGLRTEGAELSPEALEHQPVVRQKVFELGNEDLDKLARAHGIDPSEPQYSRSKEMRSEGRHQTGRQKLADDIVATIGDAEMQNLGRSAEGLKDNPDMASKAVKERAKAIFPRLRGVVDEAGNATGLQGMSPRDLHQGLGFGERNVGVTKEEFEAAKKSFNDKSTRSNAGLDPTMLVDAAKVAAYYFEGGVREFASFASQMVAKLGEAVRPHLEELYARAKVGVAPTWKGTAEEWTAARSDIDARAARSKGLPEGPKLPEAMGGPALTEEQPFRGKLTASKMERYTDPNGQFYKTVLKELQKTTTPDAARDLAQDVMADFTENVKEGNFKLPEHSSEEGRVTNHLKSIAHNKAADWVNEVSGETASGAPRKVLNTKRLSETAITKKSARTGFAKIGAEDEEETPNLPEESKSPYGFGEEPSFRDEHSNAQHALNEYLKEHPETAAEDKELLLSASKRSLEKAEAARSKAYDAELAKSNDVEKAIEAGRRAEARVNSNKFTATERYFGLTDADMTKLGQAQRLTGPKFRARLTAIMDDLNGRAVKGINEHPRTGPAPYTGHDSYTSFLSGEGPSQSAFSRISTDTTPEVAKPSETYGNAEGFISSQPKAGKPAQPDEFAGTREVAQVGTPRPLIPRIEQVIPEAGNIIQGVNEEAKRFGVDLGDRTKEKPATGLRRIGVPRDEFGNPTVSGGSQGADAGPVFYSKAERIANEKVSTGSGDSILSTLRNNGVKESEIQWMGLDDFLKGKPKVSKADLQQFIANNKIELKEVNLGGESHEQLKQLQDARNGVYVENNRIWADHLRNAPHSTELFNAMQGGDTESVIAQMPKNLQEPARNFVVTDNLLRNYDKAIDKMSKRGADKTPHYSAYTLPGEKSNYTEKLLTLPEKGNTADLRQQLAKADEERKGYLEASRPVPGDVELRFQDAQKAVRQAENTSKPFKTAHYPEEPNVLAHVRYDDRTTTDGKKVLLLEEVQSDWALQGKKHGFHNPSPTKLPDGVYIVPDNGYFSVVSREGNPLLNRTYGTEEGAREAALEHYGEGAGNPGAPNMPYKQDWHELAMKRMLREAAEKGYDRLAWVTGDQTADRYDLSKHIGRVTYDPTDNTLQAFDPKGKNVLIETVDPTASGLSEYIGKEPAQKLMEQIDSYKPAGNGEDEPDIPELHGLDLRIGGDWAKTFYDRVIPRFLNSYLKKWGGKVGESEITTRATKPFNEFSEQHRRAWPESSPEEVRNAHKTYNQGATEKVHSIEITPAMKKSLLEQGQPISKNETNTLIPEKKSGLGRIDVAA